MEGPPPPGLEFVARLRVRVGAAVPLGAVESGQRVMIPILGGRVEGPRLQGAILPGGADWATRRADGTSHVWARYALRLQDGTILGVTNEGIVGAAETGERAGHRTGRTACRIEAAEGPHGWLRDALLLGTLTVDPEKPGEVALTFWRVL